MVVHFGQWLLFFRVGVVNIVVGHMTNDTSQIIVRWTRETAENTHHFVLPHKRLEDIILFVSGTITIYSVSTTNIGCYFRLRWKFTT